MAADADHRSAWRRQRRAELDALKMARGGCVDCGYNRHPAALHWDHLGEKASPDRHAIRPSWAWARILAEVAKCELVCANCHAIRTATRGYDRTPKTRATIVRGEYGRRHTPRTICKRGHPLDDANTYTTPDGRRRCRRCNTEAHQRRRAGG